MIDGTPEAELIAALHEGIFEAPLWSTFLAKLRNATQADYAAMVFHPPGRPFGETIRLYSGDAMPEVIDSFERRHHSMNEPIKSPPRQFTEGVPHSPGLMAHNPDAPVGLLLELKSEHGIGGLRTMRVMEKTGVNAQLSIARKGGDFSAATDRLLRSIAPVLRGVLQIFVALERERFAASLAAATAHRLQFGWLALDKSGVVLDSDEQGAQLLAQSAILTRTADGQLSAKGRQRELGAAIRGLVEDSHARPKAITLSHDPWLHILLAPAASKGLSRMAPAVIAYLHGDSWQASDGCAQIAELFALTPTEARVALALSRGMSIPEAAAAFGITIGTVRNHLKAIYSKTDARGLPDLVRIVMRSMAMVPAPV